MLRIIKSKERTKMHWLQDTIKANGDNLNTVRCEANRHFWNKKKEYLEDNLKELARNNKNKNIRDLYRGINEFKRGYKLRNNFMKDGNCDLFADTHNILYKWKNYFSQLLNAHNVSDIRQMDVHTAESLVPGPSRLEAEIAIAICQVVMKLREN
jgi:hypothetical protein